MFRGQRTNNTPRQTPNPPKRIPIQPKQAFFAVFRPMGLHFGGHATSSRGLTVTNRGELHYTGVHTGATRRGAESPIGGNCTTRGSDTPATRGQQASCSAKPPPLLVRRAPEDTTGPGCGDHGRRRGLAGQRVDAPSEARSADGERAGRRPRAHQAARPHGKARRHQQHVVKSWVLWRLV